MLLRDSKRTAFLAYPAIMTTAVVLFLLRNRQITNGSSPGSGVTIALAELLVRVSSIVHWAASVGAQALSLLLRVATAPAIFVLTTLEAGFRVALAAAGGTASFLQHVAFHLVHTL